MTRTLVRIRSWFDARVAAPRDDRGAMTTEAALITALLAGGAVTVLGIVVARATGWAESIPGG
jgi:hypothetical protein